MEAPDSAKARRLAPPVGLRCISYVIRLLSGGAENIVPPHPRMFLFTPALSSWNSHAKPRFPAFAYNAPQITHPLTLGRFLTFSALSAVDSGSEHPFRESAYSARPRAPAPE